MNEKFFINVNSGEKIVDIMVKGAFSPSDAQAFVKDYNQKISSIIPNTYTLKLDCTLMQVVTPQMVPELEACYKLYKQAGFNKVIFQIKENTILKMQLNRLARNVGLTQAEVIAV